MTTRRSNSSTESARLRCDQLLSNTVRVHRKLRRAGFEAELNVYEGKFHAQYPFDDRVPETQEAFTDIAVFFGKHLGR